MFLNRSTAAAFFISSVRCGQHSPWCGRSMQALQQQAGPADDGAVQAWDGHFIDELTSLGVAQADIRKLKDAGMHTVEGVLIKSKREFNEIKGISEEKHRKIRDAALKLVPRGFECAADHYKRRQGTVRISTGSTDMDALLGGGMESGSITEVYGEFRCGKTQLMHTLAVTCQNPVDRGGGEGKALWVDTEGTFRSERCLEISRRFGMNADDVLDNIAIARAHSTDEQFDLLKSAAGMLAESRFAIMIVDSATALFRSEFKGRGELSDRQVLLGRYLRLLQRFADEFQIAVVVTNQVVSDQSSANMFVSNPVKAIGGNIMAHATTTRVKLSRSGQKRKAKLESSPYLPEGEAFFAVHETGIIDAADA